MANEYFWYDMRCEACHNTESVPGPKREGMDWHEFSISIQRYREPQFRFCEACKKQTLQWMVSYEAE